MWHKECADLAPPDLERPTGVLVIPRKEVIQPQVPLRLPCYDLAPVTELTVGRRLSEKLAIRLRVLPASMT